MAAEEIEKVWEQRNTINFSSYEQYNTEAILAYYSIDKRLDVCILS